MIATDGVVTTIRVICCGSHLGDLEWNCRAPVPSSKVCTGEVPGHGSVIAFLTQNVSVILKCISYMFSLDFDARYREVLRFVS